MRDDLLTVENKLEYNKVLNGSQAYMISVKMAACHIIFKPFDVIRKEVIIWKIRVGIIIHG